MEFGNKGALFFYRKHEWPQKDGNVIVSGVAAREPLWPLVVNRPKGTGDRFLVYFAQETQVKWDGQFRKIPPGSLVLWPMGAGHYYGSSAKVWYHSWMHFHGSKISNILAKANLKESFIIPWNDPGLFEQYLRLLHQELTFHNQPDEQLLEYLLSALFLEIGRKSNSAEKTSRYSKLVIAKNKIMSNPAYDWSLSNMAAMINMSVPNFRRLFREEYGIAPMHYVLDCRMELALYLLRDHGIPLKEIALRCGFPNATTFSRTFRKRMGGTPSQFRKENFLKM